MNVVLYSPWKNAWIPYFERAFTSRGHRFMHLTAQAGNVPADVVLHGWATGETKPVYGARNIVFLRRYELFTGGVSRVQWKGMDALVCVNDWIAERVKEAFKVNEVETPVHVIYNGTDLSDWKFKPNRWPGKRIGMACHIHPKKNLPLALQILGALPEGYELHVAGEVQDPCTAEYLHTLAKNLRRTIVFYGDIPHQQLSFWWETMTYCLSTSISEGNPNNVIEAMAKGIKPIVHAWPGAEQQFGDVGAVFRTVDEAVQLIQSPVYDSQEYRATVQKRFGLENIEKVVELALAQEAIAA